MSVREGCNLSGANERAKTAGASQSSPIILQHCVRASNQTRVARAMTRRAGSLPRGKWDQSPTIVAFCFAYALESCALVAGVSLRKCRLSNRVVSASVPIPRALEAEWLRHFPRGRPESEERRGASGWDCSPTSRVLCVDAAADAREGSALP